MTKFKTSVKYLTQGELAVKIRESMASMAKIRLEMTVGKVKNVRQLFNLRKQLAILKTYEKLSR